jgi:hypothetical protein
MNALKNRPNKRAERSGFRFLGLRYGSGVIFCEHDSSTEGFLKDEEFLEQKKYFQLFNN